MIKPSFFIGEIEDVNDPSKLGRIRVRMINHSQDKAIIPTDTLPWAITMMPSMNPNNDGIGWSATGARIGTWVFGFYQDPEQSVPVVLGAFPGMSENQPDINKLARGEGEWVNPNNQKSEETDLSESIHTKQEENVIDDIKSAGVTWSQPKPSYAATYPNNKVFESSTGHIIEIDDTPGVERIFIHHKSGTFISLDPDGSINTQIIGTDTKIVLKDSNLLIKGSTNITIEGDTNLSVKGNVTEEIDGDFNLTTSGDINLKGSTINLN
jgi:hypothetical protein